MNVQQGLINGKNGGGEPRKGLGLKATVGVHIPLTIGVHAHLFSHCLSIC